MEKYSMFMEYLILSGYQIFPTWFMDSVWFAIKIPANYFMDIDKLILKFIWRDRRPRIANTKLTEKN